MDGSGEHAGPWQPELEEIACDLCGESAATTLFFAEDRRYGLPGSFRIARCVGCGLVYVSPRPTLESLAHYYPDRYRPHAEGRQHQGRLGKAVRALAFTSSSGAWRAPIAWLYNSVAFRAFVPSQPAGRVLDVGCGPGDYLRVWKELGWEIEGLEPNGLVAARAGREIGALVRCGFAETAELPHAAYDLVTMSHSLEHLRSPRTALARLRRALKPDGRLLLMVPNFAAWERFALQNHWQGLEVPRHLFHFEPTTITAVLRATGYSVIQIGGTAHASTLLRSLRDWARMGSHAMEPGRVERAVATALLLPLAAVRRSTSLWVVARCA